MHKITALCRKHREFLLYVFFGVLTTLVNMGVYAGLFHGCRLPNVLSTILAWAAAVLFAYVTNRLWVFRSRGKSWLRELLLFVGCRTLTGVLDVGIMYAAVDLLRWNAVLWKLISNIIVTAANYLASRFLIFKQSRS